MNKDTNTSRVVIHLQVVESKINSAAALQLSELCRACLSYYRQQRILTHPVLVHCLEGSGRTASFVLMAAVISEIDVATAHNDTLLPDMVKMAALMCQQRKGILRERLHLKLAIEGVVNHARHILTNKGVLKPQIKTQEKIERHTAEESPLVTTASAEVASVGDPVSDMIASLQLSDPMAGFKEKSPTKKKITKADFANSSGDLTKRNEKSDDPLSQLDPLWSLKSK